MLQLTNFLSQVACAVELYRMALASWWVLYIMQYNIMQQYNTVLYLCVRKNTVLVFVRFIFDPFIIPLCKPGTVYLYILILIALR
jgi:hypothetical protein